MINCASCSYEFSLQSKFGFLEMKGSFHFVSKKESAALLEHLLTFDEEVIELKTYASYVLARCRNCQIDVGKKFKTRSGLEYIAFGKEKLTYGGFSCSEKDKWKDLIGMTPFKDFDRFDKSEFIRQTGWKKPVSEQSQKITTSFRSRQNQLESSQSLSNKATTESFQNEREVLGSSQIPLKKTFSEPIQIKNIPRAGFQSRRCQLDNSQNSKANTGQFQNEREAVGDSLNSKLLFLRNKSQKWDTDQLIFELTCPNKANWDKITGNIFYIHIYT